MDNIIGLDKTRNSSVELLRIIAMGIIIIHHFGVHGVFHVLDQSQNILMVDNLSWQIIFTQIVSWGGDVGNSIFILITGYFMINKNVNTKKTILLLVAMFLYSWIIELIYIYGLNGVYSLKIIIMETVPIYFGNNWFVSCYIIFSFFIPFINKFLNSISQKQYIIFILLVFIFYSFLPSFKANTFMDSKFIFFGLVYSIGGYLKLYFIKYLRNNYNKKYIKLFFIQVFIVIIMIIFSDIMAIIFSNDMLIKLYNPFIKIFSIPIAITLFLYFLTIKPIYNKNINSISGTILGIYLIHDNNLMRIIIWNYIFPNMEYINSNLYILFFVIKVCLIFIICSFIEFLRKKYLEVIFIKLLDRYWDYYNAKYKIMLEYIISKVAK